MDKTVIANQTSPFKRVEEIYQECTPEKVKEVPASKTEYHGKEMYMLQQICKKNEKPMELPPSAYLDGGAYPELHKSYEMQFPPAFNVGDNNESKAPAPIAVEPKPLEPKASEVMLSEPKAPDPKVQLTPTTLVKQDEPSVSMSRPNLVVDQSVSISHADLSDLPDVETSCPDIFINSEPAEPEKTITLTNSLANSKKGASGSSLSLFETRNDIFDTRTSLLGPEKPAARLAPPTKVEKSKPKKEEKLKIVNYESSSDEDDPSPPQFSSHFMEPHGRQDGGILSSDDDSYGLDMENTLYDALIPRPSKAEFLLHPTTPSQPKNTFSRKTVIVMFLIHIGVVWLLWKGGSENSQRIHSTNLSRPDVSLPDIINEKTPTLEVKEPVVNGFTPAGYDPDAVATLPDHKPPKGRVYGVFIAGCAMSSSMNFFLKTLLKSYGVEIMETCYSDEVALGGNWEIMKPGINRFYVQANESMSRSLELMLKEVEETGRSAIIKLEKMDLEVKTTLRDVIKPKVVYAYRGNVLDKMICEIRDCFLKDQPGLGYPVNAKTGERDDQCFNRRLPGGPKTKAYVNPNKFIKHLGKKLRGSMNKYRDLENFYGDDHYSLPKVSTEDLWAFEFSDEKEGYGRSMVAWGQILLAWGFIPDEQRIANVMNAYGFNKRKQKPHSDTIYNLDELIERFA